MRIVDSKRVYLISSNSFEKKATKLFVFLFRTFSFASLSTNHIKALFVYNFTREDIETFDNVNVIGAFLYSNSF